MLRLHLTAQDLVRTVIRDSPSAMDELVAAGSRLLGAKPPRTFVAWTARTRTALRPVMRPFLDLCAPPKWCPDFLTPPDYSLDFADGLKQVLATPAATLTAELAPRIESGELPARVGPLAAGDPDALDELGRAMVAFHTVAVAPYWPAIVAAVRTDRASRGALMVDAGIEQVLRELSPELRWHGSTLSYDCPGGADVDLAGDGRGVQLVPSYLKDQPAFCEHPGYPVTIVYPVTRLPRELGPPESLGDLIGRTRAAVLAAVATGGSSTEVAAAAGTSISSVSQHTSVLRAAGLITTYRTGPAVRHTLTPLGRSLFDAAGTS